MSGHLHGGQTLPVIATTQSSDVVQLREYLPASSASGVPPGGGSVHDVSVPSAATTSSRGGSPVRFSPTTATTYLPAASGGSVHVASGIKHTGGHTSALGQCLADMESVIFDPSTTTWHSSTVVWQERHPSVASTSTVIGTPGRAVPGTHARLPSTETVVQLPPDEAPLEPPEDVPDEPLLLPPLLLAPWVDGSMLPPQAANTKTTKGAHPMRIPPLKPLRVERVQPTAPKHPDGGAVECAREGRDNHGRSG